MTYSCVDASGNRAADVTRTVRVDAAPDTTAPVITLTGANPLVLTVDDTYTDPGAVCDDDVDADKPATPSGTVDTSTVGSYTVTYSCVDASGNRAADVTRTVRVDAAPDTTAPVITLTGANPLVLTVDDTYTDPGAVCDDDVDADKPATPSGTVDTSTVGSYTVTYSCVDASGNRAADVTRTVRVDAAPDTTAPSISGAVATSLDSITVTFSENVDADATDGSHWSLDGTDADSLTVSANTDPEGSSDSMTLTLSGDLPDTGPDDLELIYAKPNTGGITDGTNHLENATVTVADGIAPTVTSARAASGTVVTLTLSEDVSDASATPGDFSLSGVASSPTVSSISVSGKTVTLTLSSAIVTSDLPLLSYTRSSGFVQDVSNNSLANFSSMTVDTTDDTPPVIIIHGSNPARVLVGTVYSDAGATCMDNFDGDFAPTLISTVNASKAESYTVTYTCIDVASNKSEKTRTVRVLEEGDFTRSKSSKSTPLTVDNDVMIDGKSHDIGGSGTVTIKQNEVMTGEPVDITFTAHSADDIIHLTVYLNLHGDDTGYAYSDTYIRYDHGTVQIHDPHNFISDASITITDDTEQPDKKIIDIIIEFDGDMGLTNMVLYMWNEDRRSQLIRILDAFEVAAPQEPEMQAADPEPAVPGSELPADPEPLEPDSVLPADPEPVPADTLWSDDYDEAQVLHTIRMWSGFESEFITDTQLLELLGLEGYQDVDLPDWMMTELGVLVAKGDVTVGEFVLALQYVLTHA